MICAPSPSIQTSQAIEEHIVEILMEFTVKGRREATHLEPGTKTRRQRPPRKVPIESVWCTGARHVNKPR
jgi:hypothetical protein